MRINDHGHIYLDEDDRFIDERQDADNIMRISTIRLPNGALVTVERHFSTIGPNVYDAKGKKMDTYLDSASGTVMARSYINMSRVAARVTEWAKEHRTVQYQHSARYVWWREALQARIITQEEFDRGPEYCGNLWNYTGD